jgi:ankyrin repeat protein
LGAQGAAVDIRCRGGSYPLHYAAISGNVAGIRALLNSGANIHATDFEGATVCIYATTLYLFTSLNKSPCVLYYLKKT